MRIITLNATEMKSFNRRRILEHLRTQSTSRAELSRITGLTRSAISLIADGLLRDGILCEGCEQGGRVGRKSVSLVINPSAFYSIGLNISPGDFTVGLVDFGGNVHKRINQKLDPEMTAEVLELIQELAEAGQDIILSTHEMGFARAVADQVAFVAAGKIEEMSPPASLFGAPRSALCQRFLSRVMRY